MLSCHIWVTWPLTYDMTFLRWLKKLSLMVSEMKSICYIVLRSTDSQQTPDLVNRSGYVQGLDSLLRHCVCHWVSLVFGVTDFPTQEPCGAFPIALLAVTLRLLLMWEEGSRPPGHGLGETCVTLSESSFVCSDRMFSCQGFWKAESCRLHMSSWMLKEGVVLERKVTAVCNSLWFVGSVTLRKPLCPTPTLLCNFSDLQLKH